MADFGVQKTPRIDNWINPAAIHAGYQGDEVYGPETCAHTKMSLPLELEELGNDLDGLFAVHKAGCLSQPPPTQDPT